MFKLKVHLVQIKATPKAAEDDNPDPLEYYYKYSWNLQNQNLYFNWLTLYIICPHIIG
jgi:hypothetical protein